MDSSQLRPDKPVRCREDGATAEGAVMVDSSYRSEPGVTPVRVQTLKGLRLRAKRGQYADEFGSASPLNDFFAHTSNSDSSQRGRVR